MGLQKTKSASSLSPNPGDALATTASLPTACAGENPIATPPTPIADAIAFHHGVPPQSGNDAPEGERERADALEGVAHGITLPNEEDVVVGAPGCQHCETLPAPIAGKAGTLTLRFPHTHTLGKILGYLVDSPWKHHENDGVLSIEAPEDCLAPILSPLLDLMSAPEQRDTRVHFQPKGQLSQAGDLFEIEALPHLVARMRSAWLLEILRKKRLHSVFQPIVYCCAPEGDAQDATNDTGAVFGYECLMRGVNGRGETIGAGPMIDMARRADLVFQLDLAARRAAFLGASAHGLQGKIFVNFAPNSIYNPYSCLDSTLRLVDELNLDHTRIVFEITEGERLPPLPHLKRIVGFYREHGFGVALDDVGAGFSSLSVLIELQPDYVKLDMNLLRNVNNDRTRSVVAGKLLETVHELGFQSVAEGIESEGELAWARDHGAHFAQGFLFARPATPPPLIAVV